MSEDPAVAEVVRKAMQVAADSDRYEATEYVESCSADPKFIGKVYAELAQKLYVDQKDVPLMVALGQAGINYCLRESRGRQESDPEGATQFKGHAKTMAFNLGANAWPGWDDEGITITASDMANGLDAARLNLRLARELKRDHEVVGNSYWLVGAQQLMAGETAKAAESFSKAKDEFSQAGKDDYVLMSAGYLALAQKNDHATQADGERQLASVLDYLERSSSEDAKFFAAQIRTADKVLQKMGSAR